jgi:hypothetical protein
MKLKLVTIVFALLALQSFAQTKNKKETHLKLSAGSVSFGSGDILGYSISLDASKNVIKKSYWGIDKLLIGSELIFESGVKNPVIQNPTINEFFDKSFAQVSSTVLWSKVSYYPIKEVLKGFNIQLGPTFGHSYRTSEIQASRIVDPVGQTVRRSILEFDNGFTFGYRVSTGIEFDICKKFLAGFRLDFSNNTEAEINTLAGLKFGLKLQ